LEKLALLGLQEQLVQQAQLAQQAQLVLGILMVTQRVTSSTGMELDGRT
jgi:hypothetical protein